ncbi:MAG: sulfite exporter TauE/SafE family protein [Calditrichaeota bacterium]|nr:sulfite exporter TauE/SafE family protein [Calditrichota bacterium]
MNFPISGVETEWWIPLVTAFCISVFTSTGGVSGAFLLLPFQMSILGFTGPAVSATNMLYNVIAIPSGVYSYAKEKRLVKPLVLTTALGTLPGVFIGAIIRINYLPDPRVFKLFVGLVLFYIGARLAVNVVHPPSSEKSTGRHISSLQNKVLAVEPLAFNLKRIGYSFEGKDYYASFPGIFLLSLVVGIIGGIYGIGGGAIIAPFLVTAFGLPVHTVAGAALLGTFLTSVAGVGFFTLLAPFYNQTGLGITPDWMLGGLFGVGGAAGIYIGARIQRFLPARVIKTILAVCILFVALKYIWRFFF